DQSPEAVGRGRGASGRNRRQPGLLLGEVLPATALPAGRTDRIAATGIQAAVREGWLDSDECCITISHRTGDRGAWYVGRYFCKNRRYQGRVPGPQAQGRDRSAFVVVGCGTERQCESRRRRRIGQGPFPGFFVQPPRR